MDSNRLVSDSRAAVGSWRKLCSVGSFICAFSRAFVSCQEVRTSCHLEGSSRSATAFARRASADFVSKATAEGPLQGSNVLLESLWTHSPVSASHFYATSSFAFDG